jgi:outer membrane protein assembly factor BamE (lipoprotein component of BamABCDE complex)
VQDVQETKMSLPHGSSATFLAMVGGALLAAGCAPVHSHRGFVMDSALSNAVRPGVDNRDSVTGTLGRPTFVGEFDQRDWYYVARETRQFAFGMPRPVNQDVLHVRFDESGNVERVDHTGMDLVVNIRPDKDKTPTPGTAHNLFQELFGNIGAVGQANQGGSTPDNPQ